MFDLEDLLNEPEEETDTPDEVSPPEVLGGQTLEEIFAAEEPAEEASGRSGKLRRPLLIGGGVLAVLLIAAALWINATFVIAGGFHRRDAQTLDLREKSISLKNYDKLTQKLPDCDIRWGVPIGGERYDNLAESLTVSAIKEGELALFAHFSQLKTLNVTKPELILEDYQQLTALLPGCDIRWSIPIGGSRYDSAAGEIAVSDFTAEEVDRFLLFDRLTTVDARGCFCYDEILAVQALLPETRVLWDLELDGDKLDQDTTVITVDGAKADYAAMEKYLRWLPALEQVTVTNCALTTQEQLDLLAAHPEVTFLWPVTVLGTTYDSGITQLSFAGQTLTEADAQTITAVLPFFHSLEVLDLSGCGLTAQQVMPLYDIKPDLDIYWEFELYGKTFSTVDKEMDLSEIPITDLAPLEEMVVRMPNLEKVYMLDCGPSNEEMDALNKKYEDIRFVWMLHFKGFDVRTDTLGFIANGSEFSGDVTQQDVEDYLIYCSDLVALDLGHKSITDLSFVQHMPRLKYLLLGATQITDLSPLTQLKKLVFLELQLTSTLTDISPLAECTSLKDLNMGYIATGHGQEYYDTLRQMTWLERVWYSDHLMADNLDAQLKKDLPDCLIHIALDPDMICASGWRRHPRYYEMRDLLQIYYMNEYGNQTPWKWIDGEAQLVRDLIPSQEASRAAAIAEIEADRAAEKAARAAEN